MIPAQQNDLGTLLADTSSRSAVEVDLATGPVASLAGMRRVLAALTEAGAGFGDLPARHPAEWGRLTRPSHENGLALADLALSASERRLHRESEQTFRVLSVAAAAICQGSESLGVPVVLRGVGCTDMPSLRGVVRTAEFSAATGIGQVQVPAADAVQVPPVPDPAADTRAERARALRALGVQVDAADLHVLRPPGPGWGAAAPAEAADALLFEAALAPGAGPAARIVAALAYCRSSFYSSNWEGMALAAAACLPIAARLTQGDVAAIAAEVLAPQAAGDGTGDQAIEFEAALLRHPGDLRAHLLKVLGVQASFRGLQDEALGYFRAMRDLDGPISLETRAQSHLYCALTLVKRQHRLPDAVAELEAGFEAVKERAGEPPSVRRERGWLHNLRGLAFVTEGDLVAAFDHEKTAMGCIEGSTDASSVHLRVNLVSNISVLQERAGRLGQAIQTWERFRREGTEADPRFVKHHAYRAGGLRVRAGDADGAEPRLVESLGRCADAADDFHEFEIAAELGTLLLGHGRGDEAAGHYERATLAAARLGDPYRMAVAAAGLAATTRGGIGEHTADLALRSVTQAPKAQALVSACREGTDPRSFLPVVRTKLNRPFDAINL
jgi:tetratricopeptide (TPR) repeat protein